MISNKKEIHRAIDKMPSSDPKLDRIRHILTESRSIDMVQYLNSIGFVEAESLASKIVGGESVVECHMKIGEVPKLSKFNLFEQAKLAGIDMPRSTFIELSKYKHKSRSLVGKGETLLRILFAGHYSSSTNDFNVGKHKCEVKFGSSRMRGMNGFDKSDASCVMEYMDEWLIAVSKKYKIDVSDCFDMKDDNRWNFVSGKSVNRKMLLDVISRRFNSKLDKGEVALRFVEALSLYYSDMSSVELRTLTSSLKKEFDSDGGIISRRGYCDFIYKIGAFAIKYYQRIEEFDYMFILDDNLDCIVVPASYIKKSSLEELSEFIMDNFRITTPKFSYKARVQGSVFGIHSIR